MTTTNDEVKLGHTINCLKAEIAQYEHWAQLCREKLARITGTGLNLRPPREIALGHGMVDVGMINLEDRYGLVLKPRDRFIPVGQDTTPADRMIPLDNGCVVVWLDGPEFGKTIIDAINEAEALRT